jgi:type IV pilus assembly protein PilF
MSPSHSSRFRASPRPNPNPSAWATAARSAVAFAFAATLGACATTRDDPNAASKLPPPEAMRAQAALPADSELIGERADPRTRARAHAELAGAYYEMGNLGVALEEVRLAIAADPNYAPAQNMAGLVYMELRDNAQAQAFFDRAMRVAPGDPDVLHNYGWFLCQTGREDQAIPFFMRAVETPLYRTPAKSYAAAGQCALKQGKTADATAYLDRAVRLDPNNPNALVGYARVMYQTGRYADAKTAIDRFNKLGDPTPESLWLALRIERRLGDRTAETSLATQLRRRYPNSTEYRDLVQGKYE